MQLAELMQMGFVTVPRGAWLLPAGAVRSLYLAVYGRAWRIARPGILRGSIGPGEVDTTWEEMSVQAGCSLKACRLAADELRRRGLLTWVKRRQGRSWYLTLTVVHFETLNDGFNYQGTARPPVSGKKQGQPNGRSAAAERHSNATRKDMKMQEVADSGRANGAAERQPGGSRAAGNRGIVFNRETEKQTGVSGETCFFCEGTGTETSGAPCRVKCTAWQRLQGAGDGR